MLPSLPALVVAFAAPVATLPTGIWQVAPDRPTPPWIALRKERAVILVHGLRIHPLRPNLAARAQRYEWQEPKSDLVKALSREADVFAFGYAQTVALDEVPHSPGFRQAVADVRAMGYREIVLVGHSAGGVICRLFVENYPDAGVTKVIQTSAPNAGTELATSFKNGYPRVQAPFIQSLAPSARLEAFRTSRKLLDPKIEMACVVCKVKRIEGDIMVPLASQWPDELQQQGIPAALLAMNHFEVMGSSAGAKLLADLVREKLARWSPEQVEQARKVLFRDEIAPERK